MSLIRVAVVSTVVVVPEIVKFPVTVRLPPTDTSVPTNNFFAIAIPPAVVNDPPFVDEIASVVSLMPIPPDITKAPVLEDVESVVFVIDTIPLDVNPVNVPTEVILPWAAVANVPVMFPLTFKAPPIPIPPDTTKAPVVILVEAAVLEIVTTPELDIFNRSLASVVNEISPADAPVLVKIIDPPGLDTSTPFVVRWNPIPTVCPFVVVDFLKYKS